VGRSKPNYKEADESCPAAWTRFLQERWSDVHTISAEVKAGRGAYDDVAGSDVAVGEQLPKKDRAAGKKPGAEKHAANMVRGLWRKCFKQAEREGGRREYRIVAWKLDDEGNLDKIDHCARGGRIDMRGDVPRFGGDEEEESGVVRELLDFVVEMKGAVTEMRTANKDLATVVVDMGKGCAEVVKANAEGIRQAASISTDGIQRLRETAGYDKETNEQINQTKLQLARMANNTNLWDSFLFHFGDAINAWGVDGAAKFWGNHRKTGPRAREQAEDESEFETPDQQGNNGGESHLKITRLAQAWAKSLNEKQKSEMRAVMGDDTFDDLWSVCTQERQSDLEFCAAYLTIAPTVAGHIKDLASILTATQKLNYMRFHQTVLRQSATV
jgi:hypothetical protein